MAVIEFIFPIVYVLDKFIKRFTKKSIEMNERHLADLKTHKLAVAISDCADLLVSDFLIYFKRLPYNQVSVVAFQIVEEYRQIPVAEEVDVSHVVSCPTVFSGSVAMVRDLVVLLCKIFLTKITTSRLFRNSKCFI